MIDSNDIAWLSLLAVPVLGWATKKLFDGVNKEEVDSHMELKIAPIKEQIRSLESKMMMIENQLNRLEDKMDNLPDLLMKTLGKHNRNCN